MGDNITVSFPTNIYFDDIDYIVMPLIVFKEFHVLFDAEENKISFYSQDKSLLKKIEKPADTQSSSYFKTHIFSSIFIIAIICLVIGLMASICCSGRNGPTSVVIEGPINDEE